MPKTSPRDAYDQAYSKEALQTYSIIEKFEQRMGFAVPPVKLLDAARVLACPVKKNPPNWQHGRVIYAAARKFLLRAQPPSVFLDIGTAKGFSALCMAWAIADSNHSATIFSTDVLDPLAFVARNSVADHDTHLKNVPQLLERWWPPHVARQFWPKTGIQALHELKRVDFAFVDGKHDFANVQEETRLLKKLDAQVIIFDDVHIDGVFRAVGELTGYDKEIISLLPARSYCIATRRD